MPEESKFSWKEIVVGVLTTVLGAAVIFLASQLNKIPNLERTIQELPYASESQKLNDTVLDLQSTTGKNDARLNMLIFILKGEGFLDETDVKLLQGEN